MTSMLGTANMLGCNSYLCGTKACGEKAAGKLQRSFFVSQGVGVTATLIGFGAFVVWRLKVLNASDSPIFDLWEMGWPVIIAYLTLSFPLANLRSPRAVFKAILGILLLDAALLGALVFQTGGTSGSLFTPVFLLIPAVACCYYNPRGWHFWLVVGAVLGVYLFVAVLEYCKIMPPVTRRYVTGNVQEPDGYYLLLAALLTILCIGAAALCHRMTHRARSECCKGCEQLTGSDKVCDFLYF